VQSIGQIFRRMTGAFKEGYDKDTGVPVPDSLKNRPPPLAGPPPPGKDAPPR
jgi:hypothetical protein